VRACAPPTVCLCVAAVVEWRSLPSVLQTERVKAGAYKFSPLAGWLFSYVTSPGADFQDYLLCSPCFHWFAVFPCRISRGLVILLNWRYISQRSHWCLPSCVVSISETSRFYLTFGFEIFPTCYFIYIFNYLLYYYPFVLYLVIRHPLWCVILIEERDHYGLTTSPDASRNSLETTPLPGLAAITGGGGTLPPSSLQRLPKMEKGP
jgi:hypothetical protein